MTIDEAIKHCEEVADYNDKLRRYLLGEHSEENTKAFIERWTCATEHRQLAEWLRELKAYRENDTEYLQTLRYADMPTLQSAT